MNSATPHTISILVFLISQKKKQKKKNEEEKLPTNVAGRNSLLHFQLGGERCCVILPVTLPPLSGQKRASKRVGEGGGGGNGEKKAHYLEGFKREEGEHGMDMERWGENSRR